MENRFNTYISSLCRKQLLSLQDKRKRYNIFHFTGHVAAVFKLWNSFPFSDQSEIIFLRHRKGQENYFQTRRKFSLMLFIFPIFNRKSEMRRLVHSEEMRTWYRMQGYYKERKEEGQTKHIYIHENHAGPASVGACACPLLNLADPKWKKLRDIHHKIILKNIALHLFWSSWLRNMKYQITDGFLNVAILFKFWSIILDRKKEWWKPKIIIQESIIFFITYKKKITLLII